MKKERKKERKDERERGYCKNQRKWEREETKRIDENTVYGYICCTAPSYEDPSSNLIRVAPFLRRAS